MAGENHYATASRRKILEILKESKDKTVTAAQIGEQLQARWTVKSTLPPSTGIWIGWRRTER